MSGVKPALVWDELKLHINPPEVDAFARKVGIARITRNEDIYQELETLRTMQNTINSTLNDEIEKKNPSILSTPQRRSAIDRAIRFLDSLKEKGTFVDPSNSDDTQILKYLKYVRSDRPNSTDLPMTPREISTPRSSRVVKDLAANIGEIQALLDEEYQRIQTEIQEIRVRLFDSCEQLDEVKTITPPTTDSIEAFNKRLQTKEMVLKNMAKTKGSSKIGRLRDSVRLNRMWQ